MSKATAALEMSLWQWVIISALMSAGIHVRAEPSNFPRPDFPVPDGAILSLFATNDVLYLGGDFQMVGGQARAYLAALDVHAGKVLNWEPGVPRTVTSMAASSNTLYVGVRGAANVVGAFDLTTGQQPSAWAGSIRPLDIGPFLTRIFSVAIAQGRVYLSGEVTERLVYALDPVSGAILPWNPNGADQTVAESGDCIRVVGGIVYVTGEFTALGGEFRTNLVALNRDTASALPWNPAPNGRVRCLVASSNHLFVGGEFTVIGGQSRNGLAAFDLTTGNVTPWDPSGTNLNSIRLLALESNTVYVAGAFQKIGGELRANLAALDASTGGATAWNPSVTNQINALVVSGGTVYVGGGVDFPPDCSAYPYLGVFPPQGWSVLSQPFLTNGVLGFRVLGEEGSHYVVQASATLTNNWSPVSTNTVANGGFDYSEPAAHVLPRFYRAIRETSHR